MAKTPRALHVEAPPTGPVVWAREFGDNYQANAYTLDPARSPRPMVRALGGLDGGRCGRSSTGIGARLARLPGAALFLPVGFPGSVRSEYLEYQFWDTASLLRSIAHKASKAMKHRLIMM